MKFLKATEQETRLCSEVIFDSDLGKKYYPSLRTLEAKVEKGIQEDEVYLAYQNDECVGLIWYQENGIFHEFPFLHMIVVKSSVRGKGIGTLLMNFFEERALYKEGKKGLRTKVFLLVADFNEVAKKMYQSRGYEIIGEVPGLFRKRIAETLMYKIVIDQ